MFGLNKQSYGLENKYLTLTVLKVMLLHESAAEQIILTMSFPLIKLLLSLSPGNGCHGLEKIMKSLVPDYGEENWF